VKVSLTNLPPRVRPVAEQEVDGEWFVLLVALAGQQGGGANQQFETIQVADHEVGMVEVSEDVSQRERRILRKQCSLCGNNAPFAVIKAILKITRIKVGAD